MVVRLLELLGEALEAVRAGADPRTRLELALVKAARPEVDGSTRALLARIERLEQARPLRPAGRRPAERRLTAARTQGASARTPDDRRRGRRRTECQMSATRPPVARRTRSPMRRRRLRRRRRPRFDHRAVAGGGRARWAPSTRCCGAVITDATAGGGLRGGSDRRLSHDGGVPQAPGRGPGQPRDRDRRAAPADGRRWRLSYELREELDDAEGRARARRPTPRRSGSRA